MLPAKSLRGAVDVRVGVGIIAALLVIVIVAIGLNSNKPSQTVSTGNSSNDGVTPVSQVAVEPTPSYNPEAVPAKPAPAPSPAATPAPAGAVAKTPEPAKATEFWTGIVKSEATDAPLEGATVGSLTDSSDFWDIYIGVTGESVKTGPDGRFKLARNSAPNGKVAFQGLVVSAEGYESKRLVFVGSDAKINQEHVFLLGAGASITGSVKSADGVPIANAKILAMGDETSKAMMNPGASIAFNMGSGISGADGTFVIEGLKAADEVRVLAKAAGYLPKLTDPMASNSRNVELVLEKGTSAFNISVAETDGTPVPHATVMIFPTDRGSTDPLLMMGYLESKTTNEAGVLLLDGVAPGDYMISAMPKGSNMMNMGGKNAHTQEHVADGETKDVKLVFPGAKLFVGRAIDADTNQPIAGVSFSSTPYSFATIQNGVMTQNEIDNPDRKQVYTGMDGVFKIEIESQGSIAQIYYREPAGYTYKATTHQPQVGAVQVAIPSEPNPTPVDIPFEKGGIIRGVVLLPDGKTPAEGAQVSYKVQGTHGVTRTAITKATGKYELIVPPVRPIKISATFADGYAERDLTSPAGGEVEQVDLTLEEWSSISGIVYLDGEPAKGINVVLQQREFSNQIGHVAQVLTDAKGYYYAEKVAPGETTITIPNWGQQNDTAYSLDEPVIIECEAGKYHQGVDLQLTSGEELTGYVYDEEEKPISGAQISGGIDNWSRHVNLRSDKEGKFSIKGLKADSTVTYLSVHSDDYNQSMRESVTLEDDPVIFILEKRLDLKVRVVQESKEVHHYQYRLLYVNNNAVQSTRHLPNGVHNNPDELLLLAKLANGSYRIEVTQLDDAGTATGLGGMADFKMEKGTTPEEILVELDSGSEVYGTVVTGEGNLPVGDAIVRIMAPVEQVYWGSPVGSNIPDRFAYPSTTTAPDGKFRLEKVTPGAQRIEVVKEGLTLKSGPLAIVVERGRDLDAGALELVVAASIFGKVIDPEGEPVAKATIFHNDYAAAQQTGRWEEKAIVANEAGEFRIDNPSVGHHSLRIAHSTRLTATKSIQLKAGEQKEINFDFSGLVRLSGKMLANGKPIAMNSLYLMIQNTETSEMVQIDQGVGGTYSANVSPGKYKASYRRQGLEGILKVAEFEITPEPEEQTRDFNLEFVTGNVIVVFPTDQDFVQGHVTLAPPNTDFKGNYMSVVITKPGHEFKDVMPGDYVATFSSRNKEWRGDSPTITLEKGAENTILIDVHKIVRGAKIGEWKDGELSEELRTLSFDVTEHLASAGSLSFYVEYQGGNHAVLTEWVALEENGVEIGRDTHRSWSGMNTWANVYKLNLAVRKPGARYTAKVHIRSDGGTNSIGAVFMNLN